MPQVTVGFPQRGLATFDVLNATGGAVAPGPLAIPAAQLNQSPNGSHLNAQTHFREAFAGDFRAISREGGDFSSATPPLPGIGAATQGTQFAVTFTGIPGNLLVFVTMVDVTGGTKARLVAVDGLGTPPTQAGTTSTGVPVAQLRVSAAGVIAPVIGIWEWIAPQSFAIQDVAFGIVLVGSVPAGVVASIQVKGSMFPISAVVTSTAGAPIPRFADDSVTLNPGFTISIG
jgi:hypothetical protein